MNRRRALFWASPYLAGSAIEGFMAVTQFFTGGPLEWISPAIFAVVLPVYALISRNEFRRGWARGFYEGQSIRQDVAKGYVPAFVVRTEVTGTPEPEPWDEPAWPPRNHEER